MGKKPHNLEFNFEDIFLIGAVMAMMIAAIPTILKGYSLNYDLVNVAATQNKRADFIIKKLEGRKLREAYYGEKRYLIGQSMLPDKHLYLIDPYGDRKTALLVSAYELTLPEEKLKIKPKIDAY